MLSLKGGKMDFPAGVSVPASLGYSYTEKTHILEGLFTEEAEN